MESAAPDYVADGLKETTEAYGWRRIALPDCGSTCRSSPAGAESMAERGRNA